MQDGAKSQFGIPRVEPESECQQGRSGAEPGILKALAPKSKVSI